MNDLHRRIQKNLGKPLPRINDKIAHQPREALPREKLIVGKAANVCVVLLVRKRRKVHQYGVIGKAEGRFRASCNKAHLFSVPLRLRDQFRAMGRKLDRQSHILTHRSGARQMALRVGTWAVGPQVHRPPSQQHTRFRVGGDNGASIRIKAVSASR